MSVKPNLLIVGNYNRRDYIDLFKASKNSFNFYFIEFASNKEIYNTYYTTYGQSIFWGNFKDAFTLLDKVKPKKAIFIFIESYFHVALNIACKLKGIPTYHLDHGIRDVEVNVRLEKQINPQETSSRLMKILTKATQFYPRLKARLFLLNTLQKLSPPEKAFLKHFMHIRKGRTFMETFKLIDSPLRVADAYIAFSPKVYEVHKVVDNLPASKPVYFIGIPTYDHLFATSPQFNQSKSIIFIDQGLAARGIIGWTYKTYSLFIDDFLAICKAHGYTVHIKLHPAQPPEDKEIWLKADNAIMITDEELALQLPKTRLITGFCSTYLLPLAVLPFTSLLILENHPLGRINVSKSFIDAGVAHPIYNLEELTWALENVELLHQRQLPHKKKFEQDWLYRFDGKSGERLREVLLSDLK